LNIYAEPLPRLSHAQMSKARTQTHTHTHKLRHAYTPTHVYEVKRTKQ